MPGHWKTTHDPVGIILAVWQMLLLKTYNSFDSFVSLQDTTVMFLISQMNKMRLVGFCEPTSNKQKSQDTMKKSYSAHPCDGWSIAKPDSVGLPHVAQTQAPFGWAVHNRLRELTVHIQGVSEDESWR